MFVLIKSMNIKFQLNDLLNLVNRAEQNGQIKEAVSLIESGIKNLAPYEQNIAQNVKAYLQSKLPQTASEVSARAQVELSLQQNKIKNLFSRINKETIIADIKSTPVDRGEWSILRENLEKNMANLLNPRGRDFWVENFINGNIDGMSGKDMDLRFMMGAQRLVDLGIIDKSTLVIAHTGHNIPIAYQLKQNKHLGDVNGVLEFSRDSFPLMTDKVKGILELFAKGKAKAAGLSREDSRIINEKITRFKKHILSPDTGQQALLDEYLRELRECSERINNQNFTYPSTLSQITQGIGTKYLGLDFHRTARLDTTKLPTASELRTAGIKKVVFLDELHPESTFNLFELSKIYEPMTKEKGERIGDLFDMFLSNMYQGKIKEGLRAIFTLEKFVAPKDIREKILQPDSRTINAVKQKIQNSNFGYTPQQITRGDLIKYIENLKNDMPVLIEGVDLFRLEHFPFEALVNSKNKILGLEKNKFEYTADFSDLIRLIDKMTDSCQKQ